MKPAISHLNPESLPGTARGDASFRILELNGRLGVQPTSIKHPLSFDRHTLNETRGSFSLWMFSTEHVSSYLKRDVMFTAENQNPGKFSVLIDTPEIGDFDRAHFALTLDTSWHPGLIAKFYEGNEFPDVVNPPHLAYAFSSAFEFHPERWYQFWVTWDFNAEKIRVYANGVLVAAEDRFHREFVRALARPTLYGGRPTFCYGQLDFYDTVFAADQISDAYRAAAPYRDEAFDHELARVHAGVDVPSDSWEPDGLWEIVYERSMRESDVLNEFAAQGDSESITVRDDGLHVTTLPLPYQSENFHRQLYLWTRQTFEGDILIEFEFKPLQEFGLALVVFQASGMSREDFMADYPPRTSGRMLTVHSEDVRNYHCEYYRNMNAVRNDIASAAVIKNPYQWPLAYGTLPAPLEPGVWHRLRIRSERGLIAVTLDGRRVCEGRDIPLANNGPILTFGRVALRQMVDTRMVYRNLRISTRNPAYRVVPS